ncbi:Aste57867_20406 [Aphanomyces stellatus]|uniref:Aste57867_20406 protein n=1 Tax=Aphanomyces stellatus TaxID=120398 RepID=A0A485LGW9_9STRA|nr:hypothetical protein As57867_020340 [Aphanomyces stellatus]VFT97092.1 Aste57867_20406 [Aphanomyces stellatus]
MTAPMAMQLVEVDRTSSPDVINQVIAIEKAAFPKHERMDTYLMTEATTPGHVMVVAVSNGSAVCGYVLLASNSIAGRIVKIAVDPSKQRQGIGRYLLQEAIRRLYKTMCITLHVAVHRDGARHLYESLGFQMQERRQHYYGVGQDAFVMELSRSDYSLALGYMTS